MPFTPWVGIDQTLTVPLNLQAASGPNPVFGASVIGDANNRAEIRASGVLAFGPGNVNPSQTITRIAGPALACSAQWDISTAGNGLSVAEGSNAKQGTATLVAGTVTVANTSVTATSRIFLCAQSLGGTQGILAVTARTAGTSFTITSSNAADTSVVAYEIFEVG